MNLFCSIAYRSIFGFLWLIISRVGKNAEYYSTLYKYHYITGFIRAVSGWLFSEKFTQPRFTKNSSLLSFDSGSVYQRHHLVSIAEVLYRPFYQATATLTLHYQLDILKDGTYPRVALTISSWNKIHFRRSYLSSGLFILNGYIS